MDMNAQTEIDADDAVVEIATGPIDVRNMTAIQFAQLGVKQVAYVKPVMFNGAPGFAIHAADGTPMAVAPQLDTAIGAIMQHEMFPALVH
jgi:hypothetical protein